MIVDARSIRTGRILESDVCIIGAGAAGITLARQLGSAGIRVCVVEGGGPNRERVIQSLYAGESVGRSCGDLDSNRLRYFGGTTGHWWGSCRPFESKDFEKLPWIPHSGWPFPRKTLEPYYETAQEILELGPYDYDGESWARRTQTQPIAFDPERFSHRITQFSGFAQPGDGSGSPVRFGDRFRREIGRSQNIFALLYANLLHIETDESRRNVKSVEIASRNSVRATVRARQFVLACGGIENPRQLLLARLGNDTDQVGRYFMEHTNIVCARVSLVKEVADRMDFYQGRGLGVPMMQGGLALRPEVREQEQLANVSVWVERLTPSPGTASLLHIEDALAKPEIPDELGHHVHNVLRDWRNVSSSISERLADEEAYRIRTVSEQVPNPDSRVTLADTKDPLGLNRVRMDWRLTELDKRSIYRTTELVGLELGRLGLGRIRMQIPSKDSEWPEPTRYSSHHMGTTRMHDDPRQGVVDANSRVHGVENLYVAGSSVFPTGGSATPTFTLVALALRLSDHLRERLQT